MALSKRTSRAKVKQAHRRAAERRGKDLEGIQFVRTVLPAPAALDELGTPWRDVVMHTIDDSIATLEDAGCDVRLRTVVTIGTDSPADPGMLVVEVKSRAAE